jgi:hypothetical protein
MAALAFASAPFAASRMQVAVAPPYAGPSQSPNGLVPLRAPCSHLVMHFCFAPANLASAPDVLDWQLNSSFVSCAAAGIAETATSAPAARSPPILIPVIRVLSFLERCSAVPERTTDQLPRLGQPVPAASV